MIRTAIVLSPRQHAADRLYMQANGLPVDVTAASRSVVMTSHRPVQLYVASQFGQRQTAASLTAQTGMQGQHMQRIMDQLDRQGSDILPRLCRDGELAGEWFVAVDESRLNAVLSDRFQFFRFRDQSLRELRPVATLGKDSTSGAEPFANQAPGAPIGATSAPGGSDRSGLAMHHFRIEIRQGDHILVMPRGLIDQSLHGEAEAILQGVQQLPDRLSALSARLRARGVSAPADGWLAMQVLRTMTEYVAPERMPRQRLASRRKGDSEADPGFSEPVSELEAAATRDHDARAALPLRRRITWIALLAAAAVLLAIVGFLALRPKGEAPTTTTPSSTAPTTVATTAKPTPTIAATPVASATTTPRIAWYVAAQRLNLRAAPETGGTLIRTLTIGQAVYVIEQASKDWTRVETPEGETGYVYTAYIGKDKPSR